MHKSIEKLLSFIGNDGESRSYITLAVETVFGDICEELNCNDISDLASLLGEENMNMVYPIMLEFFFSNRYDNDGEWNVIDHFLSSTQAKKIKKEDKHYLEQLKSSIMMIYEVRHIEKNKSITLRNLMNDEDDIIIQENMLTNYIEKYDLLAGRIIKIGNKNEIAGGVLKLERDLGLEVIKYLKEMHGLMMTMYSSESIDIDTNIGDSVDTLSHYTKVMWASEIAQQWMLDILQHKIKTPSEIRNNDNHFISDVNVTFPIKSNIKKVKDFLEAHPEIISENQKNNWIWIDPPKKGGKSTSYLIKGFITLDTKGKSLAINTNSLQRANILQDLIETNLNDVIGAAERQTNDIEGINNISNGSTELRHEVYNIEHDEYLSEEDEKEMLLKFKDEHYKQWLKSRIPALDNKTPRMAKRTKKGTKALINLLKYMENQEAKIAKQQNITPYDFKWMWDELKLDKDAV